MSTSYAGPATVHLHVEEVPVGDPDLFLDRDRGVRIPQAQDAIRGPLHDEEGVRDGLRQRRRLCRNRGRGAGAARAAARARDRAASSSRPEYFASVKEVSTASAVGEGRREEPVADPDGLLRRGGGGLGLRRRQPPSAGAAGASEGPGDAEGGAEADGVTRRRLRRLRRLGHEPLPGEQHEQRQTGGDEETSFQESASL